MQKTMFQKFFTPAILGSLLVLCQCSKDPTKNITVNNSDEDALFMRYEVEETRACVPLKAADYAQLSPVDKVLAQPHRTRSLVEVTYTNSGTKKVTITRLAPKHPIVYPEGAITVPPTAYFSKQVYENGQVTQYDQFGEVMRTAILPADEAEISRVVDMAAAIVPVTDQQFENALTTLAEHGELDVLEEQGDLVAIRIPGASGGKTIQVIHKPTQTTTGYLHFDANGKLKTRKIFTVEGTAQNPVLTGELFETHTTSVEGNIPMRILVQGAIENFSLTLNK